MKRHHQRIKAVYGFRNTIAHRFNFRLKSAEQLIPDDQYTRIVFINILRVSTMMHTVMRWRINYILNDTKRTYPLRLNKELSA